MANPPVPNPRFLNRPRVTINMPYNSHYPQSPYIPTAATTIPNGTGQPNYPTEENPFTSMYNNKAGEFMFKQFEGFRDFTANTAKSGLNVGEKSAYWIYNRFSTWSKKWFTHIFLFLVVLCYSLAGASMFVAIEGRSYWFFFSYKNFKCFKNSHTSNFAFSKIIMSLRKYFLKIF